MPLIGIRALLLLVALVAMLPTLAFAAFLLWREAATQRAASEAVLADAARSLRAGLDREFQAAITALETLRHAEALRRDDIPAFTEVARRVRAEHPHWVGILLVRPDGQQVMNLAARPGQPLPNIARYEVIRAVIAHRRPAVSELLFDQVGRVPLVGIDVPVFGPDGGLRYILGLSIYARHFRDLAAAQPLPSGAVAAFVDNEGRVVAHTTRHDEIVGAPSILVGPEGEEALGIQEGRSGTPVLAASARSQLSGWVAAVGAPLEALEAPLRRSIEPLLAGGAAILLLSIFAASVIARRIGAPIARLAASADALVQGLGPGPARGPPGTREVAALTAALERAGTERRAAEAALAHAGRLEAVGQLTGGIAHDFNNLLQVIISGLVLLERQPDDLRRRAEVHRVMRQAADRGATLTRQLLAFARRQPLLAEPLDLGAQMRGMEELLRSSLRGDIRLEIDVPPGLWPVLADAAQLESCLLNLAVNARDAMPRGGTLRFVASNRPIDPVRDPEGLGGDFVCLSVTDTGSGMSPEVLARAVEPFFTTKDPGRGTGLGLSQVYGFARQLGGTVRIESEEGRGTSIHLLLPRAAAAPRSAPAGTEPPAVAETPGGRPLSVLVVEDDPGVATLAVALLAQSGHRAVHVAAPEAALAALSGEGRIDLLLTDVMMPGEMDGLELAAEARRRRPDLAVVVASGFPGAPDRVASSAFPLLRKPYSLRELEAAIAEARRLVPAE